MHDSDGKHNVNNEPCKVDGDGGTEAFTIVSPTQIDYGDIRDVTGLGYGFRREPGNRTLTLVFEHPNLGTATFACNRGGTGACSENRIPGRRRYEHATTVEQLDDTPHEITIDFGPAGSDQPIPGGVTFTLRKKTECNPKGGD